MSITLIRMPGFAKTLPPDQIADVIRFVRAWEKR